MSNFWNDVLNLFFTPVRWCIDSLLSIELGGVSLISILVAFTVSSVLLYALVYGVRRAGVGRDAVRGSSDSSVSSSGHAKSYDSSVVDRSSGKYM